MQNYFHPFCVLLQYVPYMTLYHAGKSPPKQRKNPIKHWKHGKGVIQHISALLLPSVVATRRKQESVSHLDCPVPRFRSITNRRCTRSTHRRPKSTTRARKSTSSLPTTLTRRPPTATTTTVAAGHRHRANATTNRPREPASMRKLRAPSRTNPGPATAIVAAWKAPETVTGGSTDTMDIKRVVDAH